MEDTRQVPYTAPRDFEFTTFQFTGRGSEYFRIWIVNLVLTILTLGIFSAWAKVRRLRYFYGHTLLDGHTFDYLADPVKILKGRLLAVLLLVAYSYGTTFFPRLAFYIVVVAVLMVPLIIATSSAFMMRNSAYRNIRFSFRAAVGEAYGVLLLPLGVLLFLVAATYFLVDINLIDPETGEAIPINELLPTLVFLLLLPLLPWLDCLRMRFVVAHARFGNLQGNFGAGVWDFYKLYIQCFFVFLLAVIVAGVAVFFLAMFDGVASAVSGAGDESDGPGTFVVAGIALIFYAMIFVVGAWFAANRGNLLRNSSNFGGKRLRGYLLTKDVARLYMGNLVLIVLTLGLFIPFAAVRLHRYNLQSTTVDTRGIDEVVATAERDPGAFGEEIGELFDVDLGL